METFKLENEELWFDGTSDGLYDIFVIVSCEVECGKKYFDVFDLKYKFVKKDKSGNEVSFSKADYEQFYLGTENNPDEDVIKDRIYSECIR